MKTEEPISNPPTSASDKTVDELSDKTDAVIDELCAKMTAASQRHRDVRTVLQFKERHGELVKTPLQLEAS